MSNRIIKSHGGSFRLLDALKSLIILEVLNPSEEIYFFSPWITNAPIIKNRKKVNDLFPFAEGENITLKRFIRHCIWRGSRVRIISKVEGENTKIFYNDLKKEIDFKRLKQEHEKGLITDNFYIHGSMNFTYSGIYINGEKVRITTEESEINQALLSAKAMWEDAEKL